MILVRKCDHQDVVRQNGAKFSTAGVLQVYRLIDTQTLYMNTHTH